ncbi:MAG TPA: methyltransferase domain-containing protein [Sedimentisphaerales bacterium]|nr:methyltransferase domain-containing protein [Sedimentisphaerales bacterium]
MISKADKTRSARKTMKLIEWLKLPEVRQIEDLDDPATTLLHGRIIQKKPFLRKLYVDFYEEFNKAVPDAEKKAVVELGSGGGFAKEIIDNVITSDVLDLPNVDKVFSAVSMPFETAGVDAFVMFDVLHHIHDPGGFFKEALRCLKVHGKIIMIEPANTLWSRFIYRNFHHERFDPAGPWGLEEAGPVSEANGALPWIIFSRDRQRFEREFPSLKIVRMRNHTPLRYLLSGGLTLRQLAPSFSYPLVKALEFFLSWANNWLGMFQTIELEKTADESVRT